jgi:tRNA modification GTPase
VTPVAGTTRDILQINIELNGILAVLSDTAGIRKAEDEVEAIGIKRALNALVLIKALYLKSHRIQDLV